MAAEAWSPRTVETYVQNSWVAAGSPRTAERGVDMPWVREILLVLLVGFGVFYLLRRSESAAGAVRSVFRAIAAAFRAIVVFLNSLAA